MQPILIKKYTNRKMYVTKGNTEPAGYVGLQGILDIVRKGKDVKIIDSETGVDITASVLKLCLEYVPLDTAKLLELLRGIDA